MIKHTKLTKSNVPIINNKVKRKKTLKKIVSTCDTPRKIFSRSTTRNGSPYPKSSRNLIKVTTKIPKLKLSSTSPRLKLSSLFSYTSPLNSIPKERILKKPKKKSGTSKNLSPKNSEKSENIIATQSYKDTIDLHEKNNKLNSESNNISQLKQMLQQVIKENLSLKNKLKKINENQEEPKSLMNSNSLDIVAEQIKSKLKDLKNKFS